MSIAQSDVVFYGSAGMPEDDVTSTGGAIDLTTKVTFTDIATTDNVTIISSNAGDTTQTVTVYGRNAAGIIVSEVLGLNGTSRVVGVTNFERISKIVINAAHAGTVTVTRDDGPTYTAIATLETGILVIRRLFYNSASDISSGSTRNYYEKVFAKNINSTLALLTAVIKEYADPTTNVTFDLEDAKDDNNSVANRLAVPTGNLGSFDSLDKNVPGTGQYLGNGEAIGIWLKLTLTAGSAATKSTYTMRASGTSV